MKKQRKNVFLWLLWSIVCAVTLTCAVNAATFSIIEAQAVAMDAETQAKVEAKVDEIAAECRTAVGETDQYQIALWLHDWLTLHAKYDNTLTIFTPDGVLLNGTGVCQSYTDAYALLLNEFGIKNINVVSVEINHTWNLVNIDGAWCHIDCTWDDPTDAKNPAEQVISGNENHNYFGMTDALMRRDHPWEYPENYPLATDIKNYYIIRENLPAVSDKETFLAYMDTVATAKTAEFDVYYIGTDATFSLLDEFSSWLKEYNWKYGIAGYSYAGNSYAMTAELFYTEPWEKPKPLETPVEGADFGLLGLDGWYASESYTNHGVLLIFGRSNCGYTRALLDRLTVETAASLRSVGVEILVNLLDCADDILLRESELHAIYPDMIFTCGNSEISWDNLSRVGYTANSVTLPTVFVYNKDGMITYYSTDYVEDLQPLLEAANAVATNHSPLHAPAEIPDPLPSPVQGLDFLLYGADGEHRYADYAENGVIVVTGFTNDLYTLNFLERLNERKAFLMDEGVEVIVLLDEFTTAEALTASELPAAYPWMCFTYSDSRGDSVWKFLQSVGDTESWVYPLSVFVYNDAGQITYYTTKQMQSYSTFFDEVYAVSESRESLKTADINDVVAIAERIKNGEELSVKKYDVTGDGKVTADDVRYLFSYTVLPELYPLE